MKIRYHRSHKVQTVQYEDTTFGATIEVDLSEDSVDEDYAGVDIKVARDLLSEDMDVFLAKDVKRAVNADQLDTMHIYQYYEID